MSSKSRQDDSQIARRVDARHNEEPSAKKAPAHAKALQVANSSSAEGSGFARAEQLESLLPDHAVELIRGLQQWCDELDKREAELNARIALVEHQERTLRLRDQSLTTKHDETRRSLERQRRELKEEIRRLQVGNINLG